MILEWENGNISLADEYLIYVIKQAAVAELADAPDLGSNATKACGCGGIGRHDRFRFYWETVQVQVLSPAVLKGSKD